MALLHQQPNSPYWDEDGNRTVCYTACDGTCDTCPASCFYGVDEDEDEEDHGYNCICETCIQNHPERDIFYGDGDFYDWEFDEDGSEDGDA